MRLILVRHGEAHAGFHGPIAGSRGCAGLTDRGRIQAQVLRDVLGRSRWMHADVLLSSVLPRAVETAEIIAPGLDLELASRDCDLCEVHTGAADGLLWSEYAERYEAFDMEDEPDRPFAPGGESWNGFHQRVAGALDRLVATYDGRTVMVVCHAGVIVASMRLLLQMPLAGARVHLRPSNTGITEWTHDASSGRWTLHTFNDASHLLGLGEDSAARPLPSGSERPEHEYSVESARDAVERGEAADWVARFLASPGSDNAVLGESLAQRPDSWLGPVRLPLDRLCRLAGPADAPVLEVVEEHEWRDDVADLAERIAGGFEPPPVIVTARADQLVVEDGNHRIEALRRAGHEHAWALVSFEDPSERAGFVVPGG
jgi:broad specificity phosphatase PhoE